MNDPSSAREEGYESDDDATGRPSEEPGVLRWRLPLALFLLTVASTFYVGASQVLGKGPDAVFSELRARGTVAALRGFLSQALRTRRASNTTRAATCLGC